MIDSKERVRPTPRRTGYASAESSVASSFTDLDLPGFIGQMLGQYQHLLVQQVERDIKRNALSAIKEESRHLQHQALERLRSMESEVQQRVQTVMDRAREGIFKMIRADMEDIFSELEASLQSLLNDARTEGPAEEWAEEQVDRPKGSAEEWAKEPGDRLEEKDAAPPERQQLQEETNVEELQREAGHQEVHLELPPPLDLRPLLGFYRGLSETKDVRILRSLGSLDKGVSLYVRPKQPASLTQLLRTLPGVQDVRDGVSTVAVDPGSDPGAENDLTLRIMLTPMGE